MYLNRGARQFNRGGPNDGPVDPPRRRRFRGQYVRRRTPSGGALGSFSDDRNDSSPPPASSSRQQPHNYNDHQQPHYHHSNNNSSNSRHPKRGANNRNNQYNNNERSQFYDDFYQQQQQRQPTISGRSYELSDGEWQNDHAADQAHPAEGPSGRDGGGRGGGGNRNSNKRMADLTKSSQDNRADIDEIKNMFSKLTTELDQVKTRVRQLESTGGSGSAAAGANREAGDELTEKDKRNKSRYLKQRERKAAKLAAARDDRQKKILNSENAASNSEKPEESNNQEDEAKAESTSGKAPQKLNRRTNRERNTDKRRPKREPRGKTAKPLPKENQNSINDDSTTQAAEPSSEDRAEGEDGREAGGKERVKVLRRKKAPVGRRGRYSNRRRRADSSERNSNDTSPQGETNGNEDSYRNKRKTRRERVFPELTEEEMNETVQTWKREFLTSERPASALKKEMNAKGPKAVYEFAVSILDHAICDVTSPTKLSEIANSLYQLLVSEDNMSEVDFQKGFYDALKDISKREDDIAIDAPRYMDTLGQLLADCVVPMYGKHKNVVRKFLNRCVEAYCPQNKAVLLASIMKAAAGIKSDRFAKVIWDTANLSWDGLLNEGTDLAEFLESHEVVFTTRTFTPEPKAKKRTPEELEKFADDITSAVESRCAPQAIKDLVKEFEIEADEIVDCIGTLIYAMVRGCLATDSGEYKLNTEALMKYSTILTEKHAEQVAIALHALTALTKLWHQYNCPQDLLRTILMELYNQGTAPFESLKTWLNAASMNNIPGIGAARLNSKRYIEDLEANLKSFDS